MEQNSRLKPATKHVIRCAAALACPKTGPTFLIGQTLNNVSALSSALTFSANVRHLMQAAGTKVVGRLFRHPIFGTFAESGPTQFDDFRNYF